MGSGLLEHVTRIMPSLVSDGKASAYNVGDLGSFPGLGRSPGEGMATHSSILAWKIPMDGGACWATVRGVSKSSV